MVAVLPGRKLTDRKVARKEGASARPKTRQLTCKLIRYQAKIAGQAAGKPSSCQQVKKHTSNKTAGHKACEPVCQKAGKTVSQKAVTVCKKAGKAAGQLR